MRNLLSPGNTNVSDVHKLKAESLKISTAKLVQVEEEFDLKKLEIVFAKKGDNPYILYYRYDEDGHLIHQININYNNYKIGYGEYFYGSNTATINICEMYLSPIGISLWKADNTELENWIEEAIRNGTINLF